jgi:hypothetical protein
MKDYKKHRDEAKEKCSSRQLKRKIATAGLKGSGRRLRVIRELLTEASLRSYGVPEFYVDEYYECIECGVKSLFSAEKQREWYEVKKRDIYVRPSRCPQHFIEWLSGRKAKYWMDVEIEKLKADPDSKDAKLRYALSVVAFHKNTGNGNLNAAIHILRKLDKEQDALSYCVEQIKKGDGETEG